MRPREAWRVPRGMKEPPLWMSSHRDGCLTTEQVEDLEKIAPQLLMDF